MNTCKNCGGPMIPMFTGQACRNECDLKAKQAKATTNSMEQAITEVANKIGTVQYYYTTSVVTPQQARGNTVTPSGVFEYNVRDILANPPAGLRFMKLTKFNHGPQHYVAEFTGNLRSNIIIGFLKGILTSPVANPTSRVVMEHEMVALSTQISNP